MLNQINLKSHFSISLSAFPNRLHFASHSHHLWPDVSFEAQSCAWYDAARLADEKWNKIFDIILPEAKNHIAKLLKLKSGDSIAIAPNTHELLFRLVSSLFRSVKNFRPIKILTTNSEFYSFDRQIRRLEEEKLAHVKRISVEPFGTFSKRICNAIKAYKFDLVFISHVFYDSGYVFDGLLPLIDLKDKNTIIAIDGYHAFMALPIDLSDIQDEIFYLAGGYKYAMSGEGACFMHCPTGYAPRPLNTGWLAGFGSIEKSFSTKKEIYFPSDGRRFLGATFDSTGFYRFNAVMNWLETVGARVLDMHNYVHQLQDNFLEKLDSLNHKIVNRKHFVPTTKYKDRGHFLTFRHPLAKKIHDHLKTLEVMTDVRGNNLRIGFAIYQDKPDVLELSSRLQQFYKSY